MKFALALLLLCLPLQLLAAGNHGVTLTWTAPPAQAACVSPCTYHYDLFEGPSAGNESSASFNLLPITALTYTDDGPTLNAYLGTTRCYYVVFTEVSGGLTLVGPQSNEVCVTFPSAPGAPTALTATFH